MNKEKQKIISDICPFYKEYGSCEQCNKDLDIDDPPCYFECMANAIINNGYRKQSEAAAEIFGEIDKIITEIYNKHIFGNNDLDDIEKEAIINFSDDITYKIDELKKKYTEDAGK